MQLLQPLAVQHVGLAAGHVLDAPGVHQHHLEAPFFQHPEQRYPVHAGGLHNHGLHTTLGQPVRQAVQVGREGLNLSHRLLRPVGGNRHEMAADTHVYAGRVQVDPGQLCRQMLCSPDLLHRRALTPLARVHIPPLMAALGGPPERATESAQSIERERPAGGVTNDAAVRLPDHALHRAPGTNALSALVRRHATPEYYTSPRDSPVSRCCTARRRA